MSNNKAEATNYEGSEAETPATIFLSSASYDRLKLIAQVILPGLGTLYFTLSQIWGLPKGEEVVGTITAVDALLGLLLAVSTRRYNEAVKAPDGKLVLGTGDPEVVLLEDDQEALVDKGEVKLVVTEDPPPLSTKGAGKPGKKVEPELGEGH